MMIFRKDIEPRCLYCEHAEKLDEEHAACDKKGVVSLGYHCRAFRYDPLSRVPPQHAAPDFSRFQDEDFTL